MDVHFYDALQEEEGTPPAPPQRHYGKQRSGNPRKRWVIIGVVAAIVLLAGAGAAYWFVLRKKPVAKVPVAVPAQQAQATGDGSTTKDYKSPTLNLEVTYRSDWVLKENTDKSEMVLTSPPVTYIRKGGSKTTGVFTLKLRNGVIPDAMQATVHNATAVKNSEVIGYTQPTGQQRQYTTVSYGGPEANDFSFFVVSGSTQYQAAQPFGTAIDLIGQAYLFAGGYGSDASDSLAFDAVPVASMDTPVFQQALDIIKTLKIY